MAIVIPQEMSLRSKRPNFTRDLVTTLPINKLADPDYDVGHIIFCNPEDASQIETKGAYIWIGYKDPSENHTTSGWVKVLDGDGKILNGSGSSLDTITQQVTTNTANISSNTRQIEVHTDQIIKINDAIEGLSQYLHVEGIVPSYTDLPKGNIKQGSIYLVKTNEVGTTLTDGYYEYLYIINKKNTAFADGKWELIGSTTIDLNKLVTKEDLKKELISLNGQITELKNKDKQIDAKDAEQDSAIKAIDTRLGDFESPAAAVSGHTTYYLAEGAELIRIEATGSLILNTKVAYIGSSQKIEFKDVPLKPKTATYSFYKINKDQSKEIIVKDGLLEKASITEAPGENIYRVPANKFGNFEGGAKSAGELVFKAELNSGKILTVNTSIEVRHRRYAGKVKASYNIENITPEIITKGYDNVLIKNGGTTIGLESPNTRYYHLAIAKNNEKMFYAYPVYLGEIPLITDKEGKAGNTLYKNPGSPDEMGGFQVKTATINGIPYYVYIETNASTVPTYNYYIY